MKYALIENNYVTNIIEWDGEGDIFSDKSPLQNNDANIGDVVIDGVLYVKPRNGFDYIFNEKTKQWNITKEGQELKDKIEISMVTQKKIDLLSSAKNVISIWQSKLLLGIITDDDKSKLLEWLTYIDELQAINAPVGSDIEWPQPPET